MSGTVEVAFHNETKSMLDEVKKMQNKYLVVPPDKFIEGYNLDVSKYVEKNYKQLSYLSWAAAELFLRQYFPTYLVEFERNKEEGYTFGSKEEGYYVLPYIIDTLTGARTPALFYAMLDSANKAVSNLSSNNINYSLQRARAKIIALTTGIGFSLYVGEDLPTTEDKLPAIEKLEKLYEEYLKLGGDADTVSIPVNVLNLPMQQIISIGKGLRDEVNKLMKNQVVG